MATIPQTDNAYHHPQLEDSHMLWKKGRRSDNVVDARGEGGGGGGMRFGGGKGLSLTAIVLIVGIGWITGQDPMQILGQLAGQMDQPSAPATTQARKAPPANDEQAEFVAGQLLAYLIGEGHVFHDREWRVAAEAGQSMAADEG